MYRPCLSVTEKHDSFATISTQSNRASFLVIIVTLYFAWRIHPVIFEIAMVMRKRKIENDVLNKTGFFTEISCSLRSVGSFIAEKVVL